MRTHRSMWGLMALVAAAGLSGCSEIPRYAATINDAGHVQIESCPGGQNLVVENSAGDVARVETASGADGRDFVDIEVETDLELDADTTLVVWESYDFDRAHDTTTTATDPASTGYEPYPVLEFTISELEQGRYFHRGRNISSGAWEDECDGDGDEWFSTGDILLFLLPYLFIFFVCVFFITLIFKALFRKGTTPPNVG